MVPGPAARQDQTRGSHRLSFVELCMSNVMEQTDGHAKTHGTDGCICGDDQETCKRTQT